MAGLFHPEGGKELRSQMPVEGQENRVDQSDILFHERIRQRPVLEKLRSRRWILAEQLRFFKFEFLVGKASTDLCGNMAIGLAQSRVGKGS